MAGHAERLEAELEAAEHKFRELDTNGAQTLYAAAQHCPMLPVGPRPPLLPRLSAARHRYRIARMPSHACAGVEQAATAGTQVGGLGVGAIL